MARVKAGSGYQRLVRRINKHPQGAPPHPLLFAVLKHLFSEREAHLVSKLPLRPFTVEKAIQAWGLSADETRRTLDRLCARALLVDIRTAESALYCLPPPMAGFFEFSLMRVRRDMDQKHLAELLFRYINVEEDFAEALFARGETQLGRVFADERQIDARYRIEVLDFEKASAVIRTAGAIGVGLCYCRRKMAYASQSCAAPLEVCLTLNYVAAALIRHGHARSATTAEAMEILIACREKHLVQFGENVREDVHFICNCCKCCCDGLLAARRFAFAHPVQSANYLPRIDDRTCNGCGLCARHCPVDAISVAETTPAATVKKARLDAGTCLGCGVCAGSCPNHAIALLPRPKRAVTPLNTAHRTVLMAIERGTLHELLFDNQTLFSHRALAIFLGVFLKLSPLKRALASKQLQSRYLETIVQRLRLQPPCTPSPPSEERKACSISD